MGVRRSRKSGLTHDPVPACRGLWDQGRKRGAELGRLDSDDPFLHKIRTVISAFRRLMRCGYRDVWNLWERQLVSGDQRAVTDARKSAGRGFGSIGDPLVH